MTKKTRRRFTPEYKEQAVARLSEAGVTYASLSAELGITSGQLKTWHLEFWRRVRRRRSLKPKPRRPSWRSCAETTNG